MRISRFIPVVLFCCTLSACGNGAPQNDDVRSAQSFGFSKLSTTSDEARQEFFDGMRELDMVRAEEALEHFKRAISADPNFALAELYAARAAERASSTEEMMAHVQRAVALSKTASEAEQLKVEVYAKILNNDGDVAAATAKELVSKDPQSPRAWLLKALADSAAGNVEESRAGFLKAIEVAPNLATPYMWLASSYVGADPRDPIKAEEYARKAVELEPNEAYAHDILGDALRGQGKFEAAAQEYTKEAELDPTRGDGYQQRGHCNILLGRYAEAMADYEAGSQASTGNTKPSFRLYKGLVSVFQNDPKRAVALFDSVYNSIDAMTISAPLEVKMGALGFKYQVVWQYRMLPEIDDVVKRIREIQQAIAKNVGTADAQRIANYTIARTEGLAAIAHGDYARARAKADEYMKIRGPEKSATKNREAHELLAFIALEQKQWQTAADEFAQTNGNDAFNNYYHAIALENLGRKAEAKALYEHIAGNNFINPSSALTRHAAIDKLKQVS